MVRGSECPPEDNTSSIDRYHEIRSPAGTGTCEKIKSPNTSNL